LRTDRALRWRVRETCPLALVAVLMLGTFVVPQARAAETQPSLYPAARTPTEDEVAAAFLLNFLRYTDWPPRSFATADTPFVIAVVGNEAVATHVRAVVTAAGRVNGRVVEVRWIPAARGTRAAPFDSAQDRENQLALLRSHLVFFHSSAGSIPVQALSDLWGKPILTVSDVPDFTRAGGMLGLVRASGRIAFEANPVAIRNARLLLSAKVLKLARLTGVRP
jgi:hypothetical protein